MPHSGGIPVGSDWTDRAADDPVFGLYKRCGFWNMAEAAILFDCARQFQGQWLDIGAHTGWTAAHIATASPANTVIAVEPMFALAEFRQRAEDNLQSCGVLGRVNLYAARSNQFEARGLGSFAGVCVDGDHDPPHPRNDAILADSILGSRGVVLFHDAHGAPVQEGVEYLQQRGYRVRHYSTVHGVTVCWRGDNNFTPPKAIGR